MYPKTPRWGRFGLAALAVAVAAGLGGVVLGGVFGIVIAGLSVLLFGLTAAGPSFLPPVPGVYKAFTAVGAVLGGAAVAIGVWG